ncbi:MAG: hypothetical protein KAX77_06350 [Xanthomonadales bacterium]|nr:hypothetical protein [Xanthomonadales bacterium]MBP8177374.1 hypothetical protein [Xanthomonadales bacterium]
MKRSVLPALLALLLPVAPLEASSFTTTSTETYKVSRLRLTSTGRVYIGIVRSPAATVGNVCANADTIQQYYFDTTTLQGRILYNQVLSSYTSQSKVSGSGDNSTCVSSGSLCQLFPTVIFCNSEQLTTFTVQQ